MTDKVFPYKIDRPSWHMGQVDGYRYALKCGKPTALLTVPEDSLDAVTEWLEIDGLHHSTKKVCDGWYSVWMWKSPLAAELIKALPIVEAQLPATVVDWYLGCLFGYPFEDIETYIYQQERTTTAAT